MVLYMSSKHGSAGNYTTWVTEYMQVSMLVNTGTCIMFSHTHQTFGPSDLASFVTPLRET